MFESIVIPRAFDNTDPMPVFEVNLEEGSAFDPRIAREIVEKFRDYLRKCFDNNYSVERIVRCASDIIDRELCCVFSHFIGSDSEDLALVAVGGYGRREQFPHSDVDLLVVTRDDDLQPRVKEKIESFISYLWDLKLEVGSSVRSITQTVLSSRQDITIITNLLETHFICGNPKIYEDMKTGVIKDEFWDAESFFEHKYNEQKERYHAYRETIFALEPDVKNIPGGLRDLQIMRWLAIKIFHAREDDSLVQVGLLSHSENEEYLACRRFLFNVRFAIHLNSRNNILRLDFQRNVASALGYGDEGNAPVEAMMRDLYRTFHRVRELNHIILQLAAIAIQGYVGDYFCDPVFLNRSFVKRGNYIDVLDHELFKSDPEKILELFLTISQHNDIDYIHVNCLRALRKGRRELKEPLISFHSCRRMFKEIITKAENPGKVLNLMHETRVLSSYMPSWARIEGLAQFDRFHLFTVDEHTIRVIRNIHNFSTSKDPNYQLFKTVYRRISDPDLLICAALLHDIAKGRGGNHAMKGSKEAEIFCRLHDYNEYETKFISWLVASHLMFNTVATRRDISDLEVINSFKEYVGDEEHLNQLYALTVADISATNDNAWTSWSDSIFKQLYQSVRSAILQGSADFVEDMRNEALERQKKALVLASDCNRTEALRYIRQFPPEYFLHYGPEDIAWHMRNILRYPYRDVPLILFSQTPNVGTELLIFYKNKSPVIFGNLVSTMALKQLNVFSAQIYLTHTSYALCTIMFQNKKGQPLDPERLSSLRKAILSGLNKEDTKLTLTDNGSKIFDIPTTISYLSSKDDKQTKLEISTLDRHGLLATIGLIFGELGYLISAARVTTTGERANDYFAITDINGMPLSESQKCELEKALKKALDTTEEKKS